MIDVVDENIGGNKTHESDSHTRNWSVLGTSRTLRFSQVLRRNLWINVVITVESLI